MEDHTHNHLEHEDTAQPIPAGSVELPRQVIEEEHSRHSGDLSRQQTPTPPAQAMGKTNDPSSISGAMLDHHSPYRRLLLMALLSFVSMYVLMYAMVNIFGNVLTNLNQVYMAGLMTAPMVVIELLLMGKMYPNKRRNAVIITASLVIGVLLFIFIRQQTGITDRQFLRSMIPHHAGAILMCEQAPVSNPEIQQLCDSILTGQQQEIDQMRRILDGMR